jgi:hypothetical protein
MATRTVACPECGSESAPGRYTCGACGALLDGVAVRPRTPAAAPDPGPATASAAALTVMMPATLDDLEDGQTDTADDDEMSPVDEDRPLMSATALMDAPVRRAGPEPQWPTWSAEEVLGRAQQREQRSPDVSEPRLPAGAILPPSAVLTPLDAAPAAQAGSPAAMGSVAPAPSGAAPSAAALAAAWSTALGERASEAVREWLDALGPAESRAAVARRTVATGAAIALLGFLLPWASAPLDVLAANWIDLWGIAGGGHWLIVLGLAAVGFAAASRGRAASWPVAIPGVTFGALLLGLVWPYVLGSTSRPFGTLVVLVGAIVLFVGGAVGLTGRHEDATPAV